MERERGREREMEGERDGGRERREREGEREMEGERDGEKERDGVRWRERERRCVSTSPHLSECLRASTLIPLSCPVCAHARTPASSHTLRTRAKGFSCLVRSARLPCSGPPPPTLG